MRVGGRRVFLEEDVEWLEVCLVLRAAGMPVRAVRAYADLVRAGDGNEGERVDLLRRRRRRLGAEIAEAKRCLSVVDRKLACYEAMAGAADARA